MTSFGGRLERICRGAVVVSLCSLALPSCERVETKEERLARAAREGDIAAVERLLADGADPNLKDPNGVTPLLIAAERGDVANVEALIKRGAAVNATDVHGQTPLMASAWFFRPAVVVALLRHGADPCLKSRDGRTALVGSLLRSDQSYASAEQQTQVIEALRVVDCDRKRPAQASAPPPAIVTPPTGIGDWQRLAFIAGYLDMFGNVMADRGGKSTGDRYVQRAEMMRDLARSRSTSQQQFVQNVDEGIRRAMNDYNSLDGRLLAIQVIEYENEGLLLWVKLMEQPGAPGPDPSAKIPSIPPYTSAEAAAEPPAADGSTPPIVEQWQAFVQQLPQDSVSAAESINNVYATNGIPFSYWVVRGVEPSALSNLNVQPHPCGRVAVVQAATIPPPGDKRVDSDMVYEVDKAGRTIRSWPVPVDHAPDGVDGDELLLPSHASRRKDLSIAVKPDGRYRVVPARGNRATPAREMCPPHTLLGGSAYAQCMLVRDDASQQTGRYLVYEAPCS